MPHMDIGHSGDVEYADHEVQYIGTNVSTTDGTSVDEEVNIEPVSQRGIDSDELAELVAMYRTASIQPASSAAAGENTEAETGLGLNLSGASESPNDASSQATILDTNESGASLRVGEIDDPGVLDQVVAQVFGGTGATSTTERFVNFREVFGSGPFVDKTDDLTIYGELQPDGTNQVKMETNYLLYWNVEEMPDGRASFSRP